MKTNLNSITSENQNLEISSQLLGVEIYDKEFVRFDEFKMGIHDVVLPPNTSGAWDNPKLNLIVILLEGTIQVDAKLCKGLTTIVLPAGRKTNIMADAKKSAHALFLVREADKILDTPLVISHKDVLWCPYFEDGEQHFILQDILDPDQVGFNLMVLDYPAKYKTVWHVHPCSHGIYVQEGVLATHEGYYGPNSFIWGPEGQIMEHGAADDTNCRLLFITDKPFDLRYLTKEEIEKL